MIVSMRIWATTWQFPNVPISSSSRAFPTVYIKTKAGFWTPVKLLLASIAFFAVTVTALVHSHAVYADPNSGENDIGTGSGDSANIELRIESGLMTLHAENASLEEVLTQVGEQVGVEILLRSDVDVPVTTSFSNEPLDGAITRLLRGTDFVMLYHPTQGADGAPLHLEITVHGYSASQTAALDETIDEQEISIHELAEDQSEEAVIARRAVALGLEPSAHDDGGLYEDLARLGRDERAHAMQWLANLGDEPAIKTLRRFLALDQDPAVRSAAALALGDVGGEAASEALTLGLGDNDPDVRYQVVEAIGAVAGDRGTLVLGQVLYSETDPEIRVSAIASLGGLPGDAARAFLESATEDPHPRVREIAEDALMFRD